MSIWKKLLSFANCTGGNSAVEFGFVAPALISALVLMCDVGLALGARMEMDRNVRAGVQAAMSQINDLSVIEDMIRNASGGSDAVALNVSKICSCNGVSTECTNWCSADEPPSVFVNITATQSYAGVMLPPSILESETHVQLR